MEEEYGKKRSGSTSSSSSIDIDDEDFWPFFNRKFEEAMSNRFQNHSIHIGNTREDFWNFIVASQEFGHLNLKTEEFEAMKDFPDLQNMLNNLFGGNSRLPPEKQKGQKPETIGSNQVKTGRPSLPGLKLSCLELEEAAKSLEKGIADGLLSTKNTARGENPEALRKKLEETASLASKALEMEMKKEEMEFQSKIEKEAELKKLERSEMEREAELKRIKEEKEAQIKRERGMEEKRILKIEEERLAKIKMEEEEKAKKEKEEKEAELRRKEKLRKQKMRKDQLGTSNAWAKELAAMQINSKVERSNNSYGEEDDVIRTKKSLNLASNTQKSHKHSVGKANSSDSSRSKQEKSIKALEERLSKTRITPSSSSPFLASPNKKG